MKNFTAYALLLLIFLFSQYSTNKNQNQSSKDETNMQAKTIMKVTSFNINSDVAPMAFAKRDAQVERDFTSKQKGFIT